MSERRKNTDSIRCFCIFCNTQKCEKIAAALAGDEPLLAIYPVHVQHTWSHGKMTDFVRPLTPGYIFVYSDAVTDAYTEGVPAFLRREILPNGSYFCLRYPDGAYELRDSDRDFALMLLERDGVIGKTEVYEEGGRIRLKDGAFAGARSEILKVDRRNGRMQIEIELTGRKIRTWVEYEKVETSEE